MGGKGEMGTPMPSSADIRRRIFSKGAGELPKAMNSRFFLFPSAPAMGFWKREASGDNLSWALRFMWEDPGASSGSLCVSRSRPILRSCSDRAWAWRRSRSCFRFGRAMKGRGVGRGMDRKRIFRRGSPIPGKATAGSNCEERVSRLTKEFEVRRLPPGQGESGGKVGRKDGVLRGTFSHESLLL